MVSTRRSRDTPDAGRDPEAEGVNSVSVTPPLTPLEDVPSPPPDAQRPKVLCLGMSYASMEKQLKYYKVNPEEWLEGRSIITVNDVLRCVQESMLTEMDARDLARIVATEATAHVEVYTVSQEKAALYDTERHLFANFNRHSFVHQLHLAFATDPNGNRQPQGDDNASRSRRSFHPEYQVRYRQVILDYFWIPQGWDQNHWSRSFFSDILPDLVRKGMLEIPDDNNNNTSGDNVPHGVYLPFCFHCFRQVINALSLLRKYYAISFLRKKDLHEVSLWKGTQTIDLFQMRKRLGKDKDQENHYCTFGYQEVMEAGNNARDEPKEMLLDILSRLEDFNEIRMIKLRPLRQHHQDINLPKEQHEKGGLKGLVDPKTVKRGFVATADVAKDAVKCVEKEIPSNKSIKKPPSTPRTTPRTNKARRPSAAIVSKRKQPEAAVTTNTPAKKRKTPAPGAVPIVDTAPPKRALFRGNTLGMPTRSRSRALATQSPAPSGPKSALYDDNATTPPRRSSRRYVSFVSLPTHSTTKKRRQSASSAVKTTRTRTAQEKPAGDKIDVASTLSTPAETAENVPASSGGEEQPESALEMTAHEQNEPKTKSISVPAVTPSPSSASKAQAMQATTTAESVARRTLPFKQTQRESPISTASDATKVATETSSTESEDKKHQTTSRSSLAALPGDQSTHGKNSRGQSKRDTVHEQSVLLTSCEQAPEVSDSSTRSSLDGSDESVKAVSVLEMLAHLKELGEVAQPPMSDTESELSDDSDEPGLTCRERLIYLDNELHPAARSLVAEKEAKQAPKKKRTIGASPNPFMTRGGRKKHARGRSTTTNVKSGTPKRRKKPGLPESSKVRRQVWKARKNEGPLSRRPERTSSPPPAPAAVTVSQSVLEAFGVESDQQ